MSMTTAMRALACTGKARSITFQQRRNFIGKFAKNAGYSFGKYAARGTIGVGVLAGIALAADQVSVRCIATQLL